MIGPNSHNGTAGPGGEVIPEPGSSPGIVAIVPNQAHSGGWQSRVLCITPDYSAHTIATFLKVNVRALCALKKVGYRIREPEMTVLLALQSYVMSDPNEGIISIENFIKGWHVSRNQSRVHGAFFGLIERGYIQIFDRRTTGTRFVGITRFGARLLEVYFQKVAELFKNVTIRRQRIDYTDKPAKFQKVGSDAVGNLYNVRMTTRNAHLYDRSKYFHEDGSIKD